MVGKLPFSNTKSAQNGECLNIDGRAPLEAHLTLAMTAHPLLELSDLIVHLGDVKLFLLHDVCLHLRKVPLH